MPDDTGGRPAENTDHPATGDGPWGEPDPAASRTATERAERGGSPGGVRSPRPADDATVAPGWQHQSIESYEAADSGGWGGPGAAALTGPVPRIRRERDERDGGDREPAGGARREPLEPQASEARLSEPEPEPSDSDDVAIATFATPPQAPQRPHDTGRAGDAADTYAHHGENAHHDPAHDNPAHDDPADAGDDGEEWRRYSAAQAAAPPSTFGARSGRAPGFARRVTASLAPITFWLIVGYLVVDFAAGVYALGSVAALGPSSDLGLVIVTVVAGLLKVVALAALARLGLEACLNLAELAGRHRGDSR